MSEDGGCSVDGMAWMLDLRPVSHERATDLLLMLGKITRLGWDFEHKVKYIGHMSQLVTTVQGNPDMGLEEIINSLPTNKYIPLAQRINAFGKSIGDDMKVLHTAREARNLLIHEGGEFPLRGRMPADSSQISEWMEKMRLHVRQLAAGENLVGSWVYSIDERQPPPRALVDGYEKSVEEWVFSSVWDLLDHGGGEIPPCYSADGHVYQDYSSFPEEHRPQWGRQADHLDG